MIKFFLVAQLTIEAWDKYGIPGLVIFALFTVLIMLHKSTHEERKDTAEAHRQERKDWNISAESRDSNWLDSANRRAEEQKVVTKELTKVIHELGQGKTGK